MKNWRANVLDGSKVEHDYTGVVVPMRRLSGARLSRILHPPGQRIDAHTHDWPVLALYRCGAFREVAEIGDVWFDGPSVVFQPAGAVHADEIGALGLETLSLSFDPAWLAPEVRRLLPRVTTWRAGGAVSAAAAQLARIWLTADDSVLKVRTADFLKTLSLGPLRASAPTWGEQAEAMLADAASTESVAKRLGLHPAWFARAYRAWRGEGVGEAMRRRRVECATVRLRTSAAPLADIAVESGFCDQSHMNRAFKTVLGRTPLIVRREAALLAPLCASAAAV